MTTAELNQELFHQLSIIAGNENLMRKVVKAIKRIVKQEKEKDTTAQILASPEMMNVIRKGDEEIAKGDIKPTKLEDLWK